MGSADVKLKLGREEEKNKLYGNGITNERVRVLRQISIAVDVDIASAHTCARSEGPSLESNRLARRGMQPVLLQFVYSINALAVLKQ